MDPPDLDRLFNPRHVAVFGASERRRTPGALIHENLLDGGFQGRVYAINPRHRRVHRKHCYPNLKALNRPVDLAIIATPPQAIREILVQCGQAHVGAALVITALGGGRVARLRRSIVTTARRQRLALLGPGTLGLARPHLSLHALFSEARTPAGDLGLVAQSGALYHVLLGECEARAVGVSLAASPGEGLGLGLPDLIDYLALDPRTRLIAVQLERLDAPRQLLSALRRATRVKPVLVMPPPGLRAHAQAGTPEGDAERLLDPLVARTGALAVQDIPELLNTVGLVRTVPLPSARSVGVICNDPEIADRVREQAERHTLRLPPMKAGRVKRVGARLQFKVPRENPVVLARDAAPQAFREVVRACVEESRCSAVLVVVMPHAQLDATATARAVTEAASGSPKPLFACWMGGLGMEVGRRHLKDAGVPVFPDPGDALKALARLAELQTHRRLAREVPAALEGQTAPDLEGARLLIRNTLETGRTRLLDPEARALLIACQVPVLPVIEAHSASEAVVAAQTLGMPVAMRAAREPPSEGCVGGIRLNINSPQAIQHIYEDLALAAPGHGTVRVEAMRGNALPLLLRMGQMTEFGPMLEVVSPGCPDTHRPMALPPLNRALAEASLDGWEPPPGTGTVRETLIDLLVRVSEMACAFPQLKGLSMEVVKGPGEDWLAAHVAVELSPGEPTGHPFAHLAIQPYPAELTESWKLRDGTLVTLRAIRPEDANLERRFVQELSPESRYFRFMQSLDNLSPEQINRLTRIDYDREMALVATVSRGEDKREVGVARYVANRNGRACEFALVVADDWRRRGLGSRLTARLIQTARQRGIATMRGEVLANNHAMLALLRGLGFTVRGAATDPGLKEVKLDLL